MTGTVLVVDDQAAVREVIADYLTEQGYVATEADAAAAISVLDRGRPDVVVADAEVLGRDDRVLALRLCDGGRPVPLVVMTQNPDACPWGAVAHLVKPFDVADLVAVVAGVTRPEFFAAD
jgi:two-component system OmpR family response regulator